VDVEVAILISHACGYLAVPERRGGPGDRVVRLFVVRLDPPDPAVALPDPMLVLGGDIGDALNHGSLAPMAARTGRVVYVVEPRGVGHSEPSLACPEFDALAPESAGAAGIGAAFQAEVTAAVEACRSRLEDEGVDRTAYGLAETAADLEDLRNALGVERWNLMAFGTNSRYALEVLRAYPEGVRAVAMDSPQFPQAPDPVIAVAGTQRAIAELTAACSADDGCGAAAPRFDRLLESALDRLNASPMQVTLETGALVTQAGRPLEVSVDGAALLRVVRFSLGGDGPANARQIVATVVAASNGVASDHLLRLLANDLTLCAGFRPQCLTVHPFSLGTYLTVLCRDDAPSIDPSTPVPDGSHATYDELFANHPYLTMCAAWDVPAAEQATNAAVESDVPILILTGQFDAFSPAPVAAEAASTLPNAIVVEVPGLTHNVIGFADCAISMRNAFIEDPEADLDASCASELRPSFLMDE
jgi:pimeloyl-ACP methyl ester carboxylesterase